MKLKDKVAIVTGASGGGAGGTGSSIAARLAKEGAKVVLVDINVEGGKALESTLKSDGYDVLFVKGDITKEDEVQAVINQTIKTYNKLDILVNNAYIYDDSEAKIADYTVSDWDKQFAVNVRGHFLFSKYAIPHLIKNEHSSIINISSMGSKSAEDKGVGYGASKAALNTLTKYTAVQYGRDNLRVNAILPGLILSDDMDKMLEQDAGMAAFFGVYDNNILLNRHGKGSDVASLVAFLASDEAEYITGQLLTIDGGMSAHATELAQMRELKNFAKNQDKIV